MIIRAGPSQVRSFGQPSAAPSIEPLKMDTLQGNLQSLAPEGLAIRTVGKSGWSLSVPLASAPDQRVLYTVGKETRPLTDEELKLTHGCFTWGISANQHLPEVQLELMRQATELLGAMVSRSS